MNQKEIMMPILIILKSFSIRSCSTICCFLLSVLITPGFAAASQPASKPAPAAGGASIVTEKRLDAAQFLLQGKNSLETGEYDKAIALLTAAYDRLPLLGDYALLWRSKAYEGKAQYPSAIEDLRALKEKYAESPLVRKAKLKEIELLIKEGDTSAGKLLYAMSRENTSNMELKYAYAHYLKEHNELSRAKELFREVFISAGPLSANASNELSPSDITVKDLVDKGKALVTAWRFEEAEKIFREALGRNNDMTCRKQQIIDSLAYSLFMQKKYREAAELYKETDNIFWMARSILRTGDMDTFRAELPEIESSPDRRMAEVMVSYGAMKRRVGNIDEAINIFNTILSLYPAAREEVLWETGWTYYLSGDYRKASKFLSQLVETYRDPKYIYWNSKCDELLADKKKLNPPSDQDNRHDFYAYLECMRNKCRPMAIIRTPLKVSLNPHVSERLDILSGIGLKDEAVSELLMLSQKNPAPGELVSISSYLGKLGNYKTSVALISRVPYREELHELYYPLAFWPEVVAASQIVSLDPYLILSVMREESRYEPVAQSVAGAVGLMQLMPQTAYKYNKKIKVNLKNTSELFNVRSNILIGSYYLRHLLDRFGSVPLALASYNGGEDTVSEWLKKRKYATVDEFIEDIPYDETRNYVKKVMTTYFEYLRSNGDSKVSLEPEQMGKL